VLEQLDALGSPATMAMAGPRFFGSSSVARYSDRGGSVACGRMGPEHRSLQFHAWHVHHRRVALGWLIDVLGLPAGIAGSFVTGTTVAHITALSAARHAVLAKTGWNVEADGLFGAPPITVITGAEAHPTLYKALGVVGLDAIES